MKAVDASGAITKLMGESSICDKFVRKGCSRWFNHEARSHGDGVAILMINNWTSCGQLFRRRSVATEVETSESRAGEKTRPYVNLIIVIRLKQYKALIVIILVYDWIGSVEGNLPRCKRDRTSTEHSSQATGFLKKPTPITHVSFI